MQKDLYRFIKIFIAVFGSSVAVLTAFVIYTDPFYQYHAPLGNMPIVLEDAVYQTPGAARNLEYTDVIVGTSMTENFRTSWFDEELGWNTMKLSYSGARMKDLEAILTQIFSSHPELNHVFMDLNDFQLTVPEWTSYVERPAYLYDTNILNDARYLFNREVIGKGALRLMEGFQGRQDNTDSAYVWDPEVEFSPEMAKRSVRDVREALLASGPTAVPMEEKLEQGRKNLELLLPFIEEHPETEFILFLPPYSMLYWETKVLQGDLENMIALYGETMKTLLDYENVRFFYFQNEQQLITELSNYHDSCHHTPEINRYIFECVRDGKNELELPDVDSAVQAMYEFAKAYDYSVYW